jgi:hypothetical protein
MVRRVFCPIFLIVSVPLCWGQYRQYPAKSPVVPRPFKAALPPAPLLPGAAVPFVPLYSAATSAPERPAAIPANNNPIAVAQTQADGSAPLDVGQVAAHFFEREAVEPALRRQIAKAFPGIVSAWFLMIDESSSRRSVDHLAQLVARDTNPFTSVPSRVRDTVSRRRRVSWSCS